MLTLPSEQQLFLHLLREELWHRDETLPIACELTTSLCMSTHDIAVKHAVEGVINKRLNELYLRAGGNKETMQRYALNKWRIVQTNKHVNSVICKTVNTLNEAGMEYVLVKGQGVARHYPTPLLRKPGDIDLYVGQGNSQRAIEALQVLTDDSVSEDDMHLAVHIDGIDVEVHHTVISHRDTHDGCILQEWAEEAMHPKSGRDIVIDDTTVRVPSAQADSLYIFYHAWHHLFHHSGVGLRQIIDWMLALHADEKEIDHTELQNNLKRAHLLTDWQVFGEMLVSYLGMPKEEFPLYKAGYDNRAAQLLNIIMGLGNHGQSAYDLMLSKRPKSGMLGRIYTMKSFLSLYASLYKVSPRSARHSCMSFFKNGLRANS